MTYEEYRSHVEGYAQRCAVLSFTKYDDPGFVALQAAGDEVVPWLLKDLANAYSDRNAIGKFCTHMAMTQLRKRFGADGPEIPENQRGRVEWIRQAWIKWGAERGYDTLQDEPLAPGVMTDRQESFFLLFFGLGIVFLMSAGVYWLLRHL